MRAEIENGLDLISDVLAQYAAVRNEVKLVGQFLDADGCASDQQGCYGMSAWLVLTSDHPANSATPVVKLRDLCASRLKELVKATDDDPERLRKASDGSLESSAYELRFITPKAASALEAVLTEYDPGAAQARLWNLILAGRNATDGGWGFRLDEHDVAFFPTAYVVRSLRGRSQDRVVQEAVAYLAKHEEKIPQPIERLYGLNTIVRFSTSSDLRESAKKGIGDLLADIVRHAKTDPFAQPNPLNVDFQDGERTRFLRIPSDLVLLEGLVLLSGPSLEFAQGPVGNRMFRRLLTSLQPPVTRDTSGHRPAFSSLIYAYDVLTLMSSKNPPQTISRWNRFRATYQHAVRFRLLPVWKLIAGVAFTIVAILAYIGLRSWPAQDWLLRVGDGLLGIGIATLFDGLGTVIRAGRTGA